MENTQIAITGISCRFAGSPDAGALWRNIISGKSLLSPLSVESALPIGTKNAFGAPYPTVGGQLGDLYSCIPSEQEFPRQLNSGENQDLYFITQLALDALADAGMRTSSAAPVRGTVRLAYAPVVNASIVNWLDHTLFIDQALDIVRSIMPVMPEESVEKIRGSLTDALPVPDAAALLSASGNSIAAWVASHTSFCNASSCIDAGMLSGIVALDAAIDDLRTGRADVALAGAVSPPLTRMILEGLSGKIRFSESDSLFPFDRDSPGTIPGEGGAFFVLKRRSDALAAHDRIYALLRASSYGTSGTCIAEAAAASDIPFASISMIEAEGSGMAECDAADVEAVRSLWGEHKPGGPLVGIGSVKGNIGNCFIASAAASVVKTALALHRRVLAPQVASPRPLESLSDLSSPVYLLSGMRPWLTGNPSSPRRAAVCASDISGQRVALIMEEEPEDRR